MSEQELTALVEQMADRVAQKIAEKTADSEVLGTEEAAALLHVKPGTLRRMTSNLEVPHYKRGGILYFMRSELIAWLKKHRVSSMDEIAREARRICDSRPMITPKPQRYQHPKSAKH